ncbi:MAG: FAD-binding protein [Burkholderiales bacterium]|nr:FAD-binding protein [Burkholderiales bacterium]
MAQLPVEINKVTTDIVVLGGGGAACRAALSARQAGAAVRLVTKAPLNAGGSTVHGASELMGMGAAGFGTAADSTEVHYEDTMRAGRGFIDPVLVRVLAEDAPARLKDLLELGVDLDRDPSGGYKLMRSDFGTHARAVSVSGKTGKAFVSALAAALARSAVAVDENMALVDLVRDAQGAIAGVVAYDASRRLLVHYEAPAVILGTGGMHGAFEQQVSTPEMTGDGQAICFRHGAELVNLEFHQFGPALVHPYVQLLSGSCFGLHPRLLNARHEEFLAAHVPSGVDLRDVYESKAFPFTTSNNSRYIDISMAREIDAGRGTARRAVYVSFASVPRERIEAVMPNTVRFMRERDLDIQRELLEVGIAFQCMNGGVRMTGPDAQSTIPGLFVIGEVAGGVRGPDRPGGNSLAEGQVFGHRSGAAAAALAKARKAGAAASLDITLDFLACVMGQQRKGCDLAALTREVQTVMQRHCLVEKTADGLNAALSTVLRVQREIEDHVALTPESLVQGLSVRNLAQASALVLRACLNRNETRSAHYRLDYPAVEDASYLHSFVMRRSGNGVAIDPYHY